jgi:hypothetical protein
MSRVIRPRSSQFIRPPCIPGNPSVAPAVRKIAVCCETHWEPSGIAGVPDFPNARPKMARRTLRLTQVVRMGSYALVLLIHELGREGLQVT